ncbi:MAG TPA: hypothetical protein VJN95_08835 [Gemmatimonadales bacterium]|nr:hypothetical protein [Gemmatimonadales bacterium]
MIWAAIIALAVVVAGIVWTLRPATIGGLRLRRPTVQEEVDELMAANHWQPPSQLELALLLLETLEDMAILEYRIRRLEEDGDGWKH